MEVCTEIYVQDGVAILLDLIQTVRRLDVMDHLALTSCYILSDEFLIHKRL